MQKISVAEIKKMHKKQDIKVAVDNCIFTVINKKLNVLLIQMKEKLEGKWALPGGLVHNRETLKNAAQRILKEQTNVHKVYLEQLYTFGEVKRDPFSRVISIAYFSLIPPGQSSLRTTKKYAGIKWTPIDKLPELAYDHKDIVKYAKKRLKWKIGYTNVAWSLLPREFTLTELQEVYETILGKKIDKRNFRRKILQLGLIEKAAGRKAHGQHRPANLYSFKNTKLELVDIL